MAEHIADSRLTIIGRAEKRQGRSCVICRCRCGNEKVIRESYVRSGRVRSCGCLLIEKSTERAIARTKHGHRRQQSTGTYNSWRQMMNRCKNSQAHNYSNYGGRGIDVCERWLEFENFLADMGERPKGKTLDRIDSDKCYEPSNCRWATAQEQSENRRSVIMVKFNGRTQSLTAWAREYGLSVQCLRDRLFKHGLPINSALTNPKWRING